MNIKHIILSLIYPCIACASAMAADNIKPFSHYGNIQNVQNYSSNPFWTPNAPYNQRMPTPVYATGVNVETNECQQIVYALISAHCAQNNNCRNMQLSDVRPTLILQLSRMPGGNYATSCNGYIDDMFNQYVSSHSGAFPTTGGPVAFPTTTGTTGTPTPTTTPDNPFSPKLQQWQQDILDRQQEIQDLQATVGGDYYALDKADFPISSADISFTERIENATAGYQPFQGKSAYHPIDIESQEAYLTRRQSITRNLDSTRLSHEEFCKRYPDSEQCAELANREKMIALLATALKDAQK